MGPVCAHFPRIAGVVPSKRDDIAINLGFPRIAGVVPTRTRWYRTASCFPRIAGVVPECPINQVFSPLCGGSSKRELAARAKIAFSPRGGGSSRNRSLKSFPRIAGVVPPSGVQKVSKPRFPRSAGVVPRKENWLRRILSFSPHRGGSSGKEGQETPLYSFSSLCGGSSLSLGMLIESFPRYAGVVPWYQVNHWFSPLCGGCSWGTEDGHLFSPLCGGCSFG